MTICTINPKIPYVRFCKREAIMTAKTISSAISCRSVIFCLIALLSVAARSWAVPVYVDSVVSFTPGSYLFGTGAPEPGDENRALGVPDGLFISLGLAGQITLRFVHETVIDGPGSDIQINAFFPGSGSQELDNKASVFASADGVAFFPFPGFIGPGGTSYLLNLASVGLTQASYVRIVDSGLCCLSGNPTGGGDGFNVESVQALNSTPVPVPEPATLILLGGVLAGWVFGHRGRRASGGPYPVRGESRSVSARYAL